MPPPSRSEAAEISSLATALKELSDRVTSIAEAYAGARRDDVASLLYQAERSLAVAQRNLERVLEAELRP